MDEVSRLHDHLAQLGRILLGYSGGVDSALLAVVAHRATGFDRFLAVIGRSDSYPAAQYRQAREVAAHFQFSFMEIETAELLDPRYLENPVHRCYFCKSELWTRLTDLAAARGFDTVLDGTNADDLVEHRPGYAAGRERGVRSPLAELGFSKATVRAMAGHLGIPVWDAPASPCLSSRVRYGVAITPGRLHQVEAAEAFLRGAGVRGNLRVRHLGDSARVEVDPEEFPLVDARWAEIVETLKGLGFESVSRAPDGYRRGSLLVLA